MAGKWPLYDVRALIDANMIAIGDGYRAKNAEFSPNGVPFARAGNINNGFQFSGADHFPEEDLQKIGDKTSQTGDVVFTSKGTVGRFAFVKDDTPRFVYSPQLCFWRSLNPEVLNSRYLYYWMQSTQFSVQFKSVASQTDMAEYVSLRDQRKMQISVPPLPEQLAIAQILGTLDDKVELNRRMNETLEAMARAQFKSWFVDFDPVRAKMEGRDPRLPTDMADLFPHRLVESEEEATPEGWKHGTLQEFASLNPESWSSKLPPDELTYVDLANTKWGYIDNMTKYLWDEAPSRARRVLRKGDTIVATVRPGNGSFALVDTDGLTGSTGFAVLRPKDVADREFVCCAATSSENIERLAHLADGGAYPAVRANEVLSTPATVADAPTRAAFSQLVAPHFDKIETNKREAHTLATIRDTLLPKLISGELRIIDADHYVSERLV